jgi:ABC-type multidrug transport system fused ATPase/permease subunit
LLRRAEILILDEATSSIDSLLEAEIQAALDAIAGSTSVVIIAHRLSTILKAGHVIVLRDGEIAEQGTPKELLARSGGLFGRLYATQNALQTAESKSPEMVV